MSKGNDEISKEEDFYFRRLEGLKGSLIKVLLISIPMIGCFFMLDIPFYLGWNILNEQYYGFILALILSCTFLLVPLNRKGGTKDRIPWYDIVLSIMGLCVGFYVAFSYRQIVMDLGTITLDRVIMGMAAILLILEATRRSTGLLVAMIGFLFLLYGCFGWVLPGRLLVVKVPLQETINYLYLDANGILGVTLAVAVVIVLAFVLFGNLLFAVGGGAFITDFSMAVFGRFRGGPAKMAVVASSLFGTISGSAVANVATTGVVTIPLMKKVGYKPHVAGAIEAVASTGGQMAPPIMGAAAFIMAEFIGVPYYQVAVAAIIPSFLYYVSLLFQVDLEAGKAGIRGLSNLPRIGNVVNKSYLFLVPFAVLVFALFGLVWGPAKAALLGVFSIFLLGFFIQRETRFKTAWIIDALYKTGEGLLQLVVICALAGIVVGVVAFTGTGFLVSLYLDQFAGGSKFILLPVVAIASLVLGMGMPTISVYIVLAVLLVPAMVRLGIEPMAAHMFIMYYGCMSMVTPPICLAAYAGAAIARADPMRTGLTASRLGIIAYIVPFLFIFFPALLFKGSPGEIIFTTLTAIAGCFCLSAALTGYLFSALYPFKRILLGISGIGMLTPVQENFFKVGFVVNFISAGLAIGIILMEWRKKSVTPS